MVKFTHEEFALLGGFGACDDSCHKYQHMLHYTAEQQDLNYAMAEA
jgi:hypothetical protein